MFVGDNTNKGGAGVKLIVPYVIARRYDEAIANMQSGYTMFAIATLRSQ